MNAKRRAKVKSLHLENKNLIVFGFTLLVTVVFRVVRHLEVKFYP